MTDTLEYSVALKAFFFLVINQPRNQDQEIPPEEAKAFITTFSILSVYVIPSVFEIHPI